MKRIVSLILAFAMLLCLCGCGEEEKAKEAVCGMMDAIKALDYDAANKYIDLSQIKLDDGEVLTNDAGKQIGNALFDKLSYEIVSTQPVDDETVKVTTKITAVDMSTVIPEYAAAMLSYAFSYALSSEKPSDEEIEQKNVELFAEAVKNNADKKVTTQVDITVKEADGAWKVQSDEDFVNALLGGLKGAAKKIEDSMNNLGNEE